MNHLINIYLPEKIINNWEQYMTHGLIDYDNLGISSYDTVERWTVECLNKNQIDLKLCAGNRSNGDPLWTECVLFNTNGAELNCSEVHDTLANEYELEDNDETYNVNVVPMTELMEKQLKSQNTAQELLINNYKQFNPSDIVMTAFLSNGDQVIIKYSDTTFKHALTEPIPNTAHTKTTTVETYLEINR